VKSREGRDADRPLYEVIYRVLRDHLKKGKLQTGLVIGEAAVARAFATSRIPAGAALRRLAEEGLISPFNGRGYLAGSSGPPLRLELSDAGLELPRELKAELTVRTRQGRLYPEIEHAVASCLAYGKFILNESALAEHYRVSRAVAHDVLARLERSGVVTQDANQRWYAGPLTAELVREHFEIRWLLEPVALVQAAPLLNTSDLVEKRDRVAGLRDGHLHPDRLVRIERDLHYELLEPCPNSQLKIAVRRSQLLLFATHSTYRHYQDSDEIVRMAAEHGEVLELLLAENASGAAKALEAHLRRSVEHNIEVLKQLPPLSDAARPPYLQPV
jgi:DNA-binding GntR family transcriptional regulator